MVRASTTSTVATSRRGAIAAFVTFGLTGAALSVAFFPAFFNAFQTYDDEGALLVAIGRFLHRGHLYVDTHGSYGPFYFTFNGAIFRLTGHDPSLFGGRIVVLVLTALTSVMFAATVWRVTRSLAFGLLGQVATYCVLATVAGSAPIRPESLILFMLSVAMYALACYASKPSTGALVAIGVVVGAVAMIRINIGIFVAVALVIGFVIGNHDFPRPFRVVLGILVLLLPSAVLFQELERVEAVQFALLVTFGLLLLYAPLSADAVSLPRRALGIVALSAVVTMAVSCIWPLATGTTPSALFHGALNQPLGQSTEYFPPVPVSFQWLMFLLTVAASWYVLQRAEGEAPTSGTESWPWYAVLGVAALAVLGFAVYYGGFGAWLPAIVLLPSLAYLAAAPKVARLALRFLTPLVILQVLHAPAVGSPGVWARVAVCVPCVIALAVALGSISVWSRVPAWQRGAAVGALGLVLVVVTLWPGATWYQYQHETSLGLPGARFVRVDPTLAGELRGLAAAIRRNCDTFYSVPALNSLYVFTGLTPPTGLVANAPGELDSEEQQQLARELVAVPASGKRMCIVRNDLNVDPWNLSSYGKGPLVAALAPYTTVVAQSGPYSVSVSGSAPGAG